MKSFTRVILLSVLALASGTRAAMAMESITGSGVAAEESRTIAAVSRVTCQGSGEVTLVVGERESLTIRADANVLPYLTSQVESGTLVLGQKANTAITTRSPITYRLTVVRLDGIQTTGSANVSGTGLASDNLSVLITGSGSVTLSGRADHQTVDLSGSGKFSGATLVGAEATIRISGSGDAIVHVNDKLNATISGSGSIRYVGAPTVTPRVSGSGQVSPMGK